MVVTRPAGKHRDTVEDDSAMEPPAQRRKLATQDDKYGEPDIIVVCKDGVEYLAHIVYLQTACEHFRDLYFKDRKGGGDGRIPRWSLDDKSNIVELVLPHIYRQSAATLREEPVQNLIAAIKLAHRLGMPLLVDHIAIYLEKHAQSAAKKLYPLACSLKLKELQKRSEKPYMRTIELSEPFQLAKVVGQENAAHLIKESYNSHHLYYTRLSELQREVMDMTCPHHGCVMHPCSETMMEAQRDLVAASMVSLHCDLLKRLGGTNIEDAAERMAEFNSHQCDSLSWDTYEDEHQYNCETIQLVQNIFEEMWEPVHELWHRAHA